MFLQGNTANYIDEMYMQWKRDPSSVHISWQIYFRNMEEGDMPITQAFQPPPTIVCSLQTSRYDSSLSRGQIRLANTRRCQLQRVVSLNIILAWAWRSGPGQT